jgi:hypothetical protein
MPDLLFMSPQLLLKLYQLMLMLSQLLLTVPQLLQLRVSAPPHTSALFSILPGMYRPQFPCVFSMPLPTAGLAVREKVPSGVPIFFETKEF